MALGEKDRENWTSKSLVSYIEKRGLRQESAVEPRKVEKDGELQMRREEKPQWWKHLMNCFPSEFSEMTQLTTSTWIGTHVQNQR